MQSEKKASSTETSAALNSYLEDSLLNQAMPVFKKRGLIDLQKVIYP